MQLDQACVHAWKEVGPDRHGQESRADHNNSGHGRRENPPPQNTLEHPAIEVAEAVEPRIECCVKSVEPAGAGALPFMLLAQQEANCDGSQGSRNETRAWRTQPPSQAA